MKTAPWYISLILFIVAIIAVPVISVIGIIASLVIYPKGFFNHLLQVSLSLDQTGNAACAKLFNLIMIKDSGYKFGNIDETASSAFGKNQSRGTLAGFGLIINKFLNWLDPNHSIDSIEDNP